MLSEGAKGSKRREEVGTCCPLGVMVVEEPLGESELTGRARGGSFRDAFGLGDFKPKRLALGCPERPRLPPLFSQSSCCPGEYRECEGYCFGRLLPAASTLEEWRGRRVCFRAIGGRGESLHTCPMSMVDAVLWRRNVKLHELTTRSTARTKRGLQQNEDFFLTCIGGDRRLHHIRHCVCFRRNFSHQTAFAQIAVSSFFLFFTILPFNIQRQQGDK